MITEAGLAHEQGTVAVIERGMQMRRWEIFGVDDYGVMRWDCIIACYHTVTVQGSDIRISVGKIGPSVVLPNIYHH